MMGDGTNDAPALAQADVAVAMNAGTMAAKEAANMVDLDSDPTKLIEVVEIGKQLLITRGSLTTFSIANDIAKYFAFVSICIASFIGWFAVRLGRRERRFLTERGEQTPSEFAALFANESEQRAAKLLFQRLRRMTATGRVPRYRNETS